jgi:hypothetical protein
VTLKLLERLKERRAEKKSDRAAIARALEASRRADDEPPRSLSETVDDVAGQYPPPP